jgi:asparagine synthase (glutamine-hydrolysing)
MLSGGIDSASVAAVSREILGVTPARQLHTFSVVADDADSCAETNNIASICRGWEGLTHQVSLPSLRGGITLDDLKEAAWVHAHPDGNSRLIPAMMYLAANRRGHRVMLDGIDGDLATYTPPRYTASLLRAGAWRVAWAEAKHASMNNTFLQGKSPLSILSRSAWDAYAPTTAKWLKDMLWDSRQKNPFTNITIHHGLAARVGFSRRVKECRARSRRMRRQSDQERHIQVLTPPGIVSGLEGFDTEAARYGMESWHPWSDKRVIEFFVRLPVHYKVRDGWTKFPVRKTMEAQLQSHVVWNPRKEHLGAELMRRLMQDSHDETRSALRNAKAKLQEYLEPGSLRTIEGHVGKKVSDVDLWDLFTTASLAHWLNNVRLAPS